MGLVGLEAMAASTPVIGSNIGGIATYINDGENGFLFEPKNSMELANNIIKYMDSSIKYFILNSKEYKFPRKYFIKLFLRVSGK